MDFKEKKIKIFGVELDEELASIMKIKDTKDLSILCMKNNHVLVRTDFMDYYLILNTEELRYEINYIMQSKEQKENLSNNVMYKHE